VGSQPCRKLKGKIAVGQRGGGARNKKLYTKRKNKTATKGVGMLFLSSGHLDGMLKDHIYD